MPTKQYFSTLLIFDLILLFVVGCGNGGVTQFAISIVEQVDLHWYWFMDLELTGLLHSHLSFPYPTNLIDVRGLYVLQFAYLICMNTNLILSAIFILCSTSVEVVHIPEGYDKKLSNNNNKFSYLFLSAPSKSQLGWVTRDASVRMFRIFHLFYRYELTRHFRERSLYISLNLHVCNVNSLEKSPSSRILFFVFCKVFVL